MASSVISRRLFVAILLLSLAAGGCLKSMTTKSPAPPPEIVPSVTARPKARPPAAPLIVVEDMDRYCLRVLVAKNMAIARRVKASLRRGGSFVEMVRRYSVAGPKHRGGYLGCYPAGRLSPKLARTVRKLKVGQVSGVMYTPQGPALVQRTTNRHLDLGLQLYQRRQYDRAVSALKRDLKLNPDRAEAWRLLGLIYAKQGKAKAAKRALGRAVSLNATDRQSAAKLIRLHLTKAAKTAPKGGKQLYLVARKDATPVRSAPAADSSVKFNLPLHGPVRITGQEKRYYAVADWMGRSGWVDMDSLGTVPFVIVTTELATARRKPDHGAKRAFVVVKSTILKVNGRQSQWILVKLDEKRVGWLHQSDVFGVGPAPSK